MPQVYLPTPLRRLTHGQARIATEGRTVEEALAELERRYPGLREQLREPTGELRRFINVFVNGTEMRALQGSATPLAETDEVSIVPAMAGGSPASRTDVSTGVSVGRRVRRGAPSAPVLRVLEASRLALHEDADPRRVPRLIDAILRDGVLRNPPVASPISAEAGGPLVVLDGANRVAALRELNVPHVVAHVVRYDAREISVSTWTHYVVNHGAPLGEQIAARLGMRIAPAAGLDEAARALDRREGVAALFDGDRVMVVGPGLEPVANAGRLRELVELYAGASQFFRIGGANLEDLSAEYGPGTAVIFPPFGKEDVLTLVTRGERLPAGITRHVVPGRVLRLNVPLAWLRSPEPAATKQRWLDDAVEDRWRSHGVRYYPEPTFLFDE